ncbi:MAG: bile acid:sodium symporter family protein [Rhodoferax sp.]|nr:bile acid:sodium symporter family protein [Rhodoferax sp.]
MRPDVVQTLLPLALAFIMFYLGLTLVVADFRQVATRPKALAVGLVGQVLLVPLAGFAVIQLSGLDPVMAVGLMVLAACPSGVSSGLLTHLARGDTALAISLTAVTSLASVLTLPLVVGAAYQVFMASQLAVQLPVAAMVKGIFVLTTLPVLLGMVLRWRFAPTVMRVEPTIGKVTTTLFVLIVLNTFWDQRQVLLDNLPTLGPAVVVLNVLILGGAYALSRVTSLTRRDRIAVITECGLKNSALGIVVSLQWLHQPAMSAPSVVYALSMNAFALTFVVLMRKTVKW